MGEASLPSVIQWCVRSTQTPDPFTPTSHSLTDAPDAMEITEVRIVLSNNSSLRAFATITVDNCLAIRDVKIIEGPKGLSIAMPSKEQKEGTYRDIVHPVNSEARRMIEERVSRSIRK